jgi:hypothetical protein
MTGCPVPHTIGETSSLEWNNFAFGFSIEQQRPLPVEFASRPYYGIMFEQEQRPEAYLARWFLISGVVGILVAAVLAGLMIHNLVPMKVALALWPTSIFGMGDLGYQRTFIETVLTAVFTFGGEFVLYGVAGWSLGYGIYVVRTFILSR